MSRGAYKVDDFTNTEEIITNITIPLNLVVNVWFLQHVGLYWFLFAMMPFTILSLFFRYKGRDREDSFVDHFYAVVYALGLGLAISSFLSYRKFIKSEYYLNSKKRGYFIPTREKKEKHIIKKLSGK